MLNKAMIIGHLGADPELKYTGGGTAVCRLSVATSRKFKKHDELVEETEWHRVTVWGKQAEACSRYLAKGRQVYVEGRLRTSKYEQDGVTKYSTEIVAENVKFLGGRGEGGEPSRGNPSSAASGSVRANEPEVPPYSPDFSADDEIPF